MTDRIIEIIGYSDEVWEVPFQKGSFEPGMYALIKRVPDLQWQDRHGLKIAIVLPDGTLKPLSPEYTIDDKLNANVLTDAVRHIGAVLGRTDLFHGSTVTILTDLDPVKVRKMIEDMIEAGEWPAHSLVSEITIRRTETERFPKT